MNEWKEGIWLAVSALLTGALLMFAGVLGNVSKGISKLQQDNINTVASMQEIRKWVKYDGTEVKQSDVISCILEYRSKVPAVKVTQNVSSDTPYYIWNGENPAADYDTQTLFKCIPLDATYRTSLIYDDSGEVTYIFFRRIS